MYVLCLFVVCITACQPSKMRNGFDKRLVCELRGGGFMMAFDGGSTANASAGNTSVTRFIHRIWSGNSGNGQPTAMAVKITSTSPRLWENIMCTNLVMFE